jgi:hypothetical protein
MTSAIQLGVAIAMFGIAGSMIFYEYVRSQTGRPLSNNEITAMPYWLAWHLCIGDRYRSLKVVAPPEHLARAERIPHVGENQELGAIQATSDPKYEKSNAKCTARDIQPRALTEVCP